jgi:cyclic beta-1,2-glucan synthetase
MPLFASAASPWDNDEILRAELFSSERLEQHAASLAVAQQVARKRTRRRSLDARLKNNESVLLAAYRTIGTAVGEGRTITPAAEWLLDNYHLVEEQIREIRADLPPGFYRQLPSLKDGPFAGYPRVFGLAWAVIAHSDSRFDPDSLRLFVRAYQRVQPLTIGELWAVAITLRIVLVENLRRAASRIVSSRAARQEADSAADRLLGVNGYAAEPDALVRREAAGGSFPPAFVVQLVLRLRDQDPETTPARGWLDQRLTLSGTTADELVHAEHQRQGASNVTVRNVITSMRLLSDVDWPEFFESVSLVDELLRSNSGFATMDFASRDLYRAAIEQLARGSKHTELDIARAALSAAGGPSPRDGGAGDGAAAEDASVAGEAGGADRRHDPGYHLIGTGRRAFEAATGFRASRWSYLGHLRIRSAGDYVAAIFTIAGLVMLLPVWELQRWGLPPGWLTLVALLGFVPSIDAAVALVNRSVTRGMAATILPGLALRDGIPPELRTLIAVPTLLTTAAAVEEHIARLEIHYLASPDVELHFALLTDWTDAPEEHAQQDAALLDVATRGIARLNRLHGPAPAGDRFILLHRRRVWSKGEMHWMGWERKRGKLHELNRLLRGANDTTFLGAGGLRPAVPPDIRYVITLDADTRLPRDAVRRMVGKMAHPLNRPGFDAASGRLVEGYAVLQPRVAPSLPTGREGSLFQRVFSSASGIDPYAAAASDVYQDLFGMGSYAGKGIYDVDAFESALADRVPDNTLLSHDLFEGTFARAGLVSDIEVVEEFPARYDVAARRQHRWARGDWQLLPWICGRGAAAGAGRGGGGLPLIALWKMLDNLRRTLSAPASVAALIAGWLLATPSALLWSAFICTTIALPALLPVLSAILPGREGITFRSHLRALRREISLAGAQTAFLIAFLAHQAASMMDAIARTMFRLFVSHRNLLQWVTAAQSKVSSRLTLPAAYRRMAGAVLIAAAGAVLVIHFRPQNNWLASPFLLVWALSPAIAVWISVSPLVAGRLALSAGDARALMSVARRTWRYFETFVTAEDRMLPPDNFQDDPKPVVAHRTSPTNIGLYLLSAVSARDFGWLATVDFVERAEATLATMDRLERFRGHYYNWYDTRDLRPLDPRYVSAVDSGNLAGHLIALANACREWIESAPPQDQYLSGIRDSLNLAREARCELPDDRRMHATSRGQIDAAIASLTAALDSAESATATGGGSPGGGSEGLAARLAELVPLAETLADIVRTLVGEWGDAAGTDLLYWSEATQRSLQSARREILQTPAEWTSVQQRLAGIEAAARRISGDMQFGFLFDRQRRLLSIGCTADGTLDSNCYDLLASEARLASFIAIAKNDIPARHWFRLGRSVTPLGKGAALISWSGSMFEYLMPSLVMRAPAGSLLDQTSRLIVQRQIRYGTKLGVPWGISESAYNARDLELTYQYSNFGVPGLGLKRGLSENAVVAPYATALAAMVDPKSAMRNFERLTGIGARGRYGFNEALDYTRSRVPDGAAVAIVHAYMAHHQGMTIVAIANVLFDGRMRSRFHAEPAIQATELLLQERAPRDVSAVHPRAQEVKAAAPLEDAARTPEVRRLQGAHDAVVQTHVLSNGRYAVMLTGAGSGYSRWGDIGVTRWREDATRDDCGSYIFLRDVVSGAVWSAGYQPSGVEPQTYQVTFAEDRAEFIRTDASITTTLEVVVSPEDDVEVRRLSITNTGHRDREIEVTSYLELVLAPPAADTAHQAFSKLFVQTEYLAKRNTLLATRRKRSPGDPDIWAGHHAVVGDTALGEPEVETDRARFLGRGRDIRSPLAVMDGRRLSGTVGTVLDPVLSLRYRIMVPAGGTARIAFWTGIAPSREAVLDLLDKHHEGNSFERAATLAWTQAQVQLRHLGIDSAEAALFQRLAGHLIYAGAAMRPSPATIRDGSGPPPGLWAQRISGDVPIVLLRIDAVEDIAIARQLLRAHEYWQMKGLAVDLVILNERAASYVQDLQSALETQSRMSQSRPQPGPHGARGAVFVLRTDLISEQTCSLLSAVARVVLVARRGGIADQLDRARRPAIPPPAPLRAAPRADTPPPAPALPPGDLEFFNGLGGFEAQGRVYVTILGPGQSTPAPWINVIANPRFGFQVAADGGGFTWSLNSREHPITPWSNDPVGDRPGEVLYLRDEETGEVWGPTAAPIRDPGASYVARHGQGFSRFELSVHDIELDLTLFVPMNDPIKISRLKIRNTSKRTRHLSVTAYVEWVLGATRGAAAPFIVTELDAETGALFARNPWDAVFGSRIAFADLAGQSQWTADRGEFLGRHGTLEMPAAMAARTPLSARAGAGLDPCCAQRTSIDLPPGETFQIAFLLGEADDAAGARTLLGRYRHADLDEVLQGVIAHWESILGVVQVKTPDRSLDILLNAWSLYQTLACRIWARSGFYQASGAYGYRDQLQDGMALAVARPDLTREHLLRAGARQFKEGDVQHWWLPAVTHGGTGQGVRTRISDDVVWLAHCVLQYVETTGDAAVLDEEIPFLDGRALQPGEHDAFFAPGVTEETATLFEHCALALEHALQTGVHGLPLFGTGDWNDGMNRVGEKGRGESVWLGWFLYATLVEFAPVAIARGDQPRATRWLEHASALRQSLELSWDGDWYRRGYFDDGTPLGSVSSSECVIDSIAQSWSVMSGAADLGRAARALANVESRLIRHDPALALLFTPPFDQTEHDPGYVKGYPPGIRENGGQYTHAATWTVIAQAMLGHGTQAAALLSLLNPINHTSSRADVQRYKVEPYVVAADVYSVAPHAGRGGWTWYTGSAGWMYRAGIEWVLGFRVRAGKILMSPCIPESWPAFEITFRRASARYRILVDNPLGVSRGIARIELDGTRLPPGETSVDLKDDGRTHELRVTLGPAAERDSAMPPVPVPPAAAVPLKPVPPPRMPPPVPEAGDRIPS